MAIQWKKVLTDDDLLVGQQSFGFWKTSSSFDVFGLNNTSAGIPVRFGYPTSLTELLTPQGLTNGSGTAGGQIYASPIENKHLITLKLDIDVVSAYFGVGNDIKVTGYQGTTVLHEYINGFGGGSTGAFWEPYSFTYTWIANLHNAGTDYFKVDIAFDDADNAGYDSSKITVLDTSTLTVYGVHISSTTSSWEVSDDSTPTLGGDLTIPVGTNFVGSTGVELLTFYSFTSAVNEWGITNANAGFNPRIVLTGGDTDVGLDIIVKGDGTIKATSTNGSTNYKTNVTGQSLVNKNWIDDFSLSGVMKNLTDDTTPQLSADLDLADNKIISSVGQNKVIHLEHDTTGAVVIGCSTVGADPRIYFFENEDTHWTIGTDVSDNDKFKINTGLGIVNISSFELDSSGNLKVLGSTITTGIKTSNNGDLRLNPDGTGTIILEKALDVNQQQVLDTKNVFFDVYEMGAQTADFSIDFDLGQKQSCRINKSGTLNITVDRPVGHGNFIMQWTFYTNLPTTVNWSGQGGAEVRWAGGTQPDWELNTEDILAFYYDGNNFYVQATQNFEELS